MKEYNVIGLMSGTSLDGLDIVLCNFRKLPDRWSYKIIRKKTIPYPADWKTRLLRANNLSGLDLVILDKEYGEYLGELVVNFIEEQTANVDFIASHGHTVYHQPEKRLTLQIGSGAALAAITGLKIISDFRTVDVALGGQGAPLVPMGDELLFSEYDYCLNLGGIGNISFRIAGERIAFDICPVNMAINTLMQKVNQDIDTNGEKGRSGSIIPEILIKLNALDYYKLEGPRSLGIEWFESAFLPIIEKEDCSLIDLLRTAYEHIAVQIGNVIKGSEKHTVLVTGGGAHNTFLVERIRQNSPVQFIIPDDEIIDYKESLIFAFLGVLRDRNEINCFASVTGASRDNIGGTIYVS